MQRKAREPAARSKGERAAPARPCFAPAGSRVNATASYPGVPRSCHILPLPPGPKPHFLTGHLPEMRDDLLGLYFRCAREFGDVALLRIGLKRAYLLSHPDLIEEVLVTQHRNFIKHYALRMNQTLLGNGLLTSNGDLWLRQRRLAQPAFHRDRLAAYAEFMTAYAERLAASWHDGEVRDLHKDMTRLTLEIIVKTLFNADVRDKAQDVGAALTEAMGNFNARFFRVFRIPESIPTPGNLRMRRAVRRLDAILYGFIHERRRDGACGDLLSLLLEARDEDGSRMTDKQLRDEAMTLFLAGHDTTALVLSWGWYLLAQHPEVVDHLEAELRDVLGGRSPAMADLPRLRYTEMIVLEIMRLYPPAYVIGREAMASVRPGRLADSGRRHRVDEPVGDAPRSAFLRRSGRALLRNAGPTAWRNACRSMRIFRSAVVHGCVSAIRSPRSRRPW